MGERPRLRAAGVRGAQGESVIGEPAQGWRVFCAAIARAILPRHD